MTEKEEDEEWIVKGFIGGGFLGGEKAWTVSKVNFRKVLGKRLLVSSVSFWVLVWTLCTFLDPRFAFLGFIACLMTILGYALYSEANYAEQIGKAKLQKK